ncbi:hypothetical protein ABZ252_06820 [Streptomyces sp. NPDC006175]|uniref:hypothetical protein n=1 Tax=unclassified Streptomyces TaxID=2593676 RepID=UPI0033A3F66B
MQIGMVNLSGLRQAGAFSSPVPSSTRWPRPHFGRTSLPSLREIMGAYERRLRGVTASAP